MSFRTIISKIIIFISAAFVMAALLVLTALIPEQMIRDNMTESAVYLAESELFGTAMGEYEGSRIDRYADSILMNIAYYYTDTAPVRSVLLSAYYFSPIQEENENFLEAVRDRKAANQQYLRYWHGSIAIVRPLLLLISVKQIYILNAIVLIVLFIAFIAVAVKAGLKVPAVALSIALVLTGSWFVPLSLEYTWTFMVMFVASIIAARLAAKGRRERYIVFFMLVGMVTNFLDFLTTETITLLVPLLVIMWKQRGDISENHTSKVPSAYLMSAKAAVSWLAGYALMWITKWVVTAVVFHENTMPYIMEHIGERLSGDVGADSVGSLTGAITNNIACLFPIGYGGWGAIAGITLIVIAAYVGYVHRAKEYDTGAILLFALIGIVPYIRYLVLHNHSYIHCFFTYRAQVATIMAIVLILAELLGVERSREVRHGKV